MANSLSNGTHRTFLIKVNPGAAPRGVGVPHDAFQWEHGVFSTRHPRKTIKRDGHPKINLRGEQTADPRDGDRLYIWINEKYGGRGLTASAQATNPLPTSPLPTSSGLSIAVSGVELLLGAGIDRNYARRLAEDGNVFDDILASTSGATLRWIPHDWARQINEEVSHRLARNRPTGQNPVPAQPPPLFPINLESVEAGRQARLRLIEQRANQGPFRDAVMARDRRRCVVTGCRTTEVLEAAHLIPYASGHPERDNPVNGILLRADVHLLFDRYLMAINPETMTIWLSDRLSESAYARLEGKRVRTAAGLDNLRYQYNTTTGRVSDPILV